MDMTLDSGCARFSTRGSAPNPEILRHGSHRSDGHPLAVRGLSTYSVELQPFVVIFASDLDALFFSVVIQHETQANIALEKPTTIA